MPSGRWLVCGLVLVVVVTGCSTTMTGRRQLTLIDDTKMDALGAAAFSELKRRGELSEDQMVNAYVECVATAIIAVVPDDGGAANGPWEALVFEDAAPNAFALPGGKVGIYTGMLDVAVTPGQLAAVLGHEIGHVLLRHGNERLSQSILVDNVLQFSAMAAGAVTPELERAVVGGLGVSAQYGVLLPFNRKHENEADQVGQLLMARAGFYPAEAITFWQKMRELGHEPQKQWQSTHPSDETRIVRLQANLPRAMREYETARAAGKDPRCVPPVVYE